MPGEPIPDALKEGWLVGREFGVFVDSDGGRGGGRRVVVTRGNLLASNKEAIARTTKRGTSNQSDERSVGLNDEGGDIGWLDHLTAGNFVSVASGAVVDIDQIALFEAFKAGKDIFIRI